MCSSGVTCFPFFLFNGSDLISLEVEFFGTRIKTKGVSDRLVVAPEDGTSQNHQKERKARSVISKGDAPDNITKARFFCWENAFSKISGKSGTWPPPCCWLSPGPWPSVSGFWAPVNNGCTKAQTNTKDSSIKVFIWNKKISNFHKKEKQFLRKKNHTVKGAVVVLLKKNVLCRSVFFFFFESCWVN